MYVFVSLLSISGCSYKKVKPDKEILSIQNSTQDSIDQNLSMPVSEQCLKTGLSCEQAIGIALQNSDSLQAKFKELGVAKADLVQAGLYSNPHLLAIFQFATPNRLHFDTYIQIIGSWNVSDLWVVPRRKKVSQDQLEIVTFDIMETILDIRLGIQKAYTNCLCANAQVYHAQELLRLAQKLYNCAQQQPKDKVGFMLDMHRAQVFVEQIRIAVAQALFEQRNAFINLASALGVSISGDPILLTDQLTSIAGVEGYILPESIEHHPKILKAQLKIRREKNRKSFEKSRFLNDFSLGFYWNNTPSNDMTAAGAAPAFVGPTIGLSVPCFDTNYAQVARAEFLIHKAEHDYANVKDSLLAYIASCRAEMSTAQMIIDYYAQIVDAYENFIEYENDNFKLAKFGSVSELNIHLSDLFDRKKDMLKAYTQLRHAIASFEHATGGKLCA